MSLLSRAPISASDLAGTPEFGRLRLVSYTNVGAFVAALDSILIIAASVFAGGGYHILWLGQDSDVDGFAGIGVNAALLFILLTQSRGLYRAPLLLSAAKQFRGTILGWAVVLLAITAFLFLLKVGESYSRG